MLGRKALSSLGRVGNARMGAAAATRPQRALAATQNGLLAPRLPRPRAAATALNLSQKLVNPFFVPARGMARYEVACVHLCLCLCVCSITLC